MNGTELLTTPQLISVTGPLVAPWGIVAVTDVSLQACTGAFTSLIVTLCAPALAQKPEPFKITEAPTAPSGGAKLVITGYGTLKGTSLLLRTEFTVTVTGPVVAPVGTLAMI